MQVPYLEALNARQYEAVTAPDGPLLVLAGAGSGKTRVLTHRIAYLIQERNVAPWRIFAVTFTNKAAGEMRERVASLLGRAASEVWISTFHSSCAKILRQEAQHLGYSSDFSIYDAADAEALARECIKQCGIDPKVLSPRAVANRIDSMKNGAILPDEFSAAAESHYDKKIAQIYTLYQDGLRRNNAMDFGDLILQTLRLFREHPQRQDYWRARFDHVLVDEYQDTNHSQYLLVRAFADEREHITVVGDDDQSIYRWRGADVSNILEFEQDFPRAIAVTLDQNYRSTKRILAAAGAVVGRNSGRKPKTMWTENPEGAEIRFLWAGNEHQESAWVIDRIEEQQKHGFDFHDAAIFYRVNSFSRVIEEELIARRIPYVIVGGLRFYERKEIKDALAYLRLLHNPHDSVSFRRVVNTPKRGIGDGTVDKLAAVASELDVSLMAAISPAIFDERIPKSGGSKLRSFAGLIKDHQELLVEIGLKDTLISLLEQSQYLDALREEGSEQALDRIDNLQELVSAVEEFRERSGDASLTGFLENVSLVSDIDRADLDAPAVTLMTVHSAKGLEFPLVFMVGMEENVFPHSRSMDDQAELEEERRLCYVGMTRARQKLFLSAAASRPNFGQLAMNPVSRFISEIPEEILTREDKVRRSTITTKSYVDDYHVEYDTGDSFSRPQPLKHGMLRKKTAEPSNEAAFGVGEVVSHSTLGAGVVEAVSGTGPYARLQIRFDNAGRKTVMASFVQPECNEN